MIRFHYRLSIFDFLFFILFVFNSCNQKGNQASEGNLDLKAIASDTTMQLGMESSYEYAKSIIISSNLVYDIQASGSLAKGNYYILRRSSNNQKDTVARGARVGKVVNVLTADLNKDNNPEIYIALQSADSSKRGSIIAWEFDKDGKGTSIKSDRMFAGMLEFYKGKDTIYIGSYANNQTALILEFPAYKNTDSFCCPTAGPVKIFYLYNKKTLYHNGIAAADSTKEFMGIKF